MLLNVANEAVAWTTHLHVVGEPVFFRYRAESEGWS
jgi:hypothetical protein